MSNNGPPSIAEELMATIRTLFTGSDEDSYQTYLREEKELLVAKEASIDEREKELIEMSSKIQSKKEEVHKLLDELKFSVLSESPDLMKLKRDLTDEIADEVSIWANKKAMMYADLDSARSKAQFEHDEHLSSLESELSAKAESLEDEYSKRQCAVENNLGDSKHIAAQLGHAIVELNNEIDDKKEKLHNINQSFELVVKEAVRYQDILKQRQDKLQEMNDSIDTTCTASYNRIQKMKKIVNLNIGDTMFTVSTALLQKHPETVLGQLLTDKLLAKESFLKSTGGYFFDEDPAMFPYVLEALRTGRVNYPYNHKKNPTMVNKLDDALHAFNVNPSMINFDDSCCDVTGAMVKSHLHDSNLTAKLGKLVPWSLANELANYPETFIGSKMSVMEVSSLILTFEYQHVKRIFEIDVSVIEACCSDMLHGIVSESKNVDGVYLYVDIDHVQVVGEDNVSDEMILSDSFCDLFKLPHGSKLSKFQYMFSPEQETDWTIHYDYGLRDKLSLTRDQYLSNVADTTN